MQQDQISLKVLANKIKGAIECNEPFKSDAIQAIDEFNKLLPHGSGIDSYIYIDMSKSKPEKIIVYFDYHHMNENGYYEGWTEHNLILTPSFINGFDMRITGHNKNQCKDYFYELFGNVFTD